MSWTELRNLKEINVSYPVARLHDRMGTNCIPDGKAVSYVHVPVTAGSFRSLVRVPGDGVQADYNRENQWADLVSGDGNIRYRNDGLGYRLLHVESQLPPQSY